MKAHQLVTEALTAHGCNPRGTAARCPAHDDNKASLSYTNGNDRVLIKCQAGCATFDVVAALGLREADLFDEPAKPGKTIVKEYPYLDEKGTLLFTKIRYEPKDFRCRRADGAWSLGNTRRVLYRLPELAAAITSGTNIYVVEGEKDADALQARGHVATCNFDGAAKNGQAPKWKPEYGDALRGAHVIVIADRDEAGYAHARAIRDDLKDKAASLEVLEAKEGKDISDHFAAGLKVRDLVKAQLDDDNEQVEWDAVALMGEEFPHRPWAVPGVLPPGLGMLSAPPKAGKSFWVLGIAVAVATGRLALGAFPTDRGDVLYMALEDGARRVRDRLRLHPDTCHLRPGALTVRTVSPRLDNGGLDEIDKWAASRPDTARLIIVDVFQAIRSSGDGRGKVNAYIEDYEALRGLRRVANRRGVTVLVVHHNNKTKSEDPLMMMSGSTGLSGVVDFVAVLRRERNEGMGTAYVVGRDVEDVELVMDFHAGTWTATDYPARLLNGRNKQRRTIFDVVRDAGTEGVSADHVAESTGQTLDAAKKALQRMADDGLLEGLGMAAPGSSRVWRVPNKGVSFVSTVSLASTVSTSETRTNPYQSTLDTKDTKDTKDTQDTKDTTSISESQWPPGSWGEHVNGHGESQ